MHSSRQGQCTGSIPRRVRRRRNGDLPYAKYFKFLRYDMPFLCLAAFLTVEGPTSNVYLLRQIESVITATAQYPLAETLPESENNPRSDANLLTPHDSYLLAACWDNGLPVELDHGVDPYVLPPTSRLSSMIEMFFSDINPMWGYLYESAFRDTFSQAKETGFKHVRRSWPGLLNIILAMVEHRQNLDTSSEDSLRSASYLYFSRALVLGTRTTFRGPNLETGR